MAMTHCETLADRFASMAADGLVDVKFYARNVQEASTEQLCDEVSRIYAAYERNEFEPLRFNDSYR